MRISKDESLQVQETLLPGLQDMIISHLFYPGNAFSGRSRFCFTAAICSILGLHCLQPLPHKIPYSHLLGVSCSLLGAGQDPKRSASGSFESLCSTFLKVLVLKTLFLVTVISSRQLSEIRPMLTDKGDLCLQNGKMIRR